MYHPKTLEAIAHCFSGTSNQGLRSKLRLRLLDFNAGSINIPADQLFTSLTSTVALTAQGKHALEQVQDTFNAEI